MRLSVCGASYCERGSGGRRGSALSHLPGKPAGLGTCDIPKNGSVGCPGGRPLNEDRALSLAPVLMSGRDMRGERKGVKSCLNVDPARPPYMSADSVSSYRPSRVRPIGEILCIPSIKGTRRRPLPNDGERDVQPFYAGARPALKNDDRCDCCKAIASFHPVDGLGPRDTSRGAR